MHAAIFWGFVILTIGTLDRVTFGAVHDGRRPGRSTAGCGGCYARAPEPDGRRGPGRASRARSSAAPRGPAAPPDAVARRAADPAADRRRGGSPSCSRRPSGSPATATRTRRGRGRRTPSRARLGRRCRRTSLAAGYAVVLLGQHRARQLLPGLPAALQAPPHRDRVLQHRVPQARAARPSCRRWTWRRRPRASASRRSPTCRGRTCSTASRAPSAAAARTPARPGPRASRSTPRR